MNAVYQTRQKTRKLVVIGMLSGISIFLGLTGLGFINIPPVKATIMHIPVIIGAIIEGPIVGGLIGLVLDYFLCIKLLRRQCQLALCSGILL